MRTGQEADFTTVSRQLTTTLHTEANLIPVPTPKKQGDLLVFPSKICVSMFFPFNTAPLGRARLPPSPKTPNHTDTHPREGEAPAEPKTPKPHRHTPREGEAPAEPKSIVRVQLSWFAHNRSPGIPARPHFAKNKAAKRRTVPRRSALPWADNHTAKGDRSMGFSPCRPPTLKSLKLPPPPPTRECDSPAAPKAGASA